jgi:large subunit ribosomal protein L17
LRHERIETTEAKAKAVRADAEKMITLGKRGDIHARRLAAQTIIDPDVTKKLFEKLGPRYKDRKGGYTRLFKVGPRLGDAAPVVIMELVDREA